MRQLKISNKITSRESIALEKYLTDIGRIDLLTPEDEAQLAVRIREGDQAALERLTKANLRFVVSVAKQYQNQGLSLADLINEGNVGLIKAAKRFDETRGFKFISYAVWWIRQSIMQAIVEYSRLVRMPNNKAAGYNKVSEAIASFQQKYEREPEPEELAEMLNVTLADVERALSGRMRHLSFDAPVAGDDSEITMLDTLASDGQNHPDVKIMHESLSKEVLANLSLLAPRERTVLACYFGLDGETQLNLEEIGERFDLTRERVRQIKERAIRRLRRNRNNSLLKGYLG
ncbi:RNA polymerase sigma factor RpoD/SigA [Neolewinella lacunae]|uniref:RNA polymerase sigma factor RpoD/SigA n=1 Tax=Neolewinella lacunae TaxID=1517758 RepID=A0A923PMG4_9BACT|nr:RNA polymerase sigma factor RpoD/SigA [Neolewinella lacunae]MBC6993232.1 RNA polymerase sigma factor RpoD/SigA [Neolewinella lacunae]MDN3635721.1 RNA polymerase sigma factor RpoD/SigA [Neolewinella lacunae]